MTCEAEIFEGAFAETWLDATPFSVALVLITTPYHVEILCICGECLVPRAKQRLVPALGIAPEAAGWCQHTRGARLSGTFSDFVAMSFDVFPHDPPVICSRSS